MTDIVCSALLLVVFSPIALIVAILVRLIIGSPVLFRQIRPGLKARPFELLKFRTMTIESDSNGNQKADEERLGRFGRALRATSLDELPSLWCVLRGDMSLVGPRPLLVDYLPLYSVDQMRRHEVKPGITGLAQVKGRNELSWNEKFQLDVWYVENQTWMLDLRILLMTIYKVISRQGIAQPGRATADRFRGNTP